MEILSIEVAFRADSILRWIELMKVLLKRRVMAGSQTSKQCVNVFIFDLFCVTRSLVILVYKCSALVGASSQIVSLITWIKLEKKIGRMVLVAMLVTSLAAFLAGSLPGMAEWPGIHWIKMEDKMELMELWIGDVQGFDEMSASHNDLISVQKRTEIEQWLALVDVHSNVDSMAAVSSS